MLAVMSASQGGSLCLASYCTGCCVSSDGKLLIWLQAQCILFKRYPEVLEPFKYAGYPMLLQAVALPQQDQGGDPSAHFLGPEQAPCLQVDGVWSSLF